jgi:hypothetical protein
MSPRQVLENASTTKPLVVSRVFYREQIQSISLSDTNLWNNDSTFPSTKHSRPDNQKWEIDDIQK